MERKIGEIFTLPDGRRVRVDRETVGCVGCIFFDHPKNTRACYHNKAIRGECSWFMRGVNQGVIFTDITDEKPLAPFSAPGVDTDKLTEAFNVEIIDAARDAFVYRFWDYPNTRLAEIMTVSEATVRRIRKKRLQKNKTQD